MKMLLSVNEPLPKLVYSKYQQAKESGSLIFAPSLKSTIYTKTNLAFQLRYCPSLAKKPTNSSAKDDKPKDKKKNPFENPKGDLFIGSIPTTNPTHNLVLNKFPIIDGHFILATKEFKLQTDDLEPEDLAVTYSCLESWETDNLNIECNKLFAFFNSGPNSGASQPHRHVQFLPISNIIDGYQDKTEHIKSLISTDTPYPALPFKVLTVPIPPNPSKDVLYALYTSLLLSIRVLWKQKGLDQNQFSYNMGLSTTCLLLCPRVAEGDKIGSGFVSSNGSILAGGIMVKGEEEWEALKSQKGLLDDILSKIGIPQENANL